MFGGWKRGGRVGGMDGNEWVGDCVCLCICVHANPSTTSVSATLSPSCLGGLGIVLVRGYQKVCEDT